ncbi:hypothetical protein D9619_001873 [Psilocybe cf. subviscida]|uniref:Ribosomal RNA-processing protein 17 n=1 Tax=Psilocybe cf. subviscida TaxID=2480587 RepID=A0A8H5BFK0_9AGAR|nr:hypothetical protein D9619_001873 [Psilocybe cf. subviscida]
MLSAASHLMSNIALLTKSHNAIAAKKKARKDQIKEILFDDDARREFLTGFHKRKLAKAEAAREKAKARAKQERLESRREQRQMLREKAKENAAQVEQAYGAVIENDDESWDGIKDDDNARDDEYEDEEQLATVTVVEDFDPDTIIHGPEKPEPSTAPRPGFSTAKATPPPELPPSSRRIAKKSQPKVREKKIRYETKDARKREQTKQRARRTEKAERAGGKASRKSNAGPGKGSKKTSSGGGKRRHPSKGH